MDRSFVAENARERKRLRLIVERLTDAELRLPMYAGWTIAAALGHLAYWDQRSLMLIRKWKKNGLDEIEEVLRIHKNALLSWSSFCPHVSARKI